MRSFGHEFTTAAANWSGDESLETTAALHIPYVGAAEHTLQEIYQASVDKRITDLSDGQKGGIEHGTKVIMRYLDHAISAAAEQEVEYSDAIGYLQSEAAMLPLADIASQPNAVARHLEGMLCLGQDATCTLEVPEAYIYKWQSGRLSHPGLSYSLGQFRASYEEQENKDIDPAKICRAQKAHQLAPISFALLDICIKDPRLFSATYAQTAHARKDSLPLV